MLNNQLCHSDSGHRVEHFYQTNFEFGAVVQEMKFKDPFFKITISSGCHFVQQRGIIYDIGKAKYGRFLYKIILNLGEQCRRKLPFMVIQNLDLVVI